MDPSEHGEVPESLRQGEPCGCQVLSWQRHRALWADGYKAIKVGTTAPIAGGVCSCEEVMER